MLIAFVGSEASGKSTIIAEMGRRLAATGRPVVRIHAGKPPSTALTFVPHVLLPAFRRVFPGQRTTRVEAHDRGSSPGPVPPLFAVRSVMLAYERRALLARASRASARGAIVLCDRFPSSRNGAPDGPQLGGLAGGGGVRGRLATTEARCYAGIAPPDLVVHLTAPLEVTLARNASREKREPEDYVRRRHSATWNLEFDGARVERIDTDRPLDETAHDVETAIRDAMGAGAR
jgi:thymidylate kinase